MCAEEIIIIHSNDLHSHFEQMPRIAGVVSSFKRNQDHVIAVDCGDHIDRMRVETEGSDGLANIEVMNQTGYDLATIGNNEGLTCSPETLDRLYGDHAGFKTVCCNLLDVNQELPRWLSASVVVEKGGVRLGFIGATANFHEFYSLLGWTVTDPVSAISDEVRKIRGQVDVVILMSHLGIKLDRRIAGEIEGIDVILGAHTHHLFETPEYTHQTYLCAAGKFGEYIGILKMKFDMVGKKLITVEGRAAGTDEFEPDPVITRLIEEWRERSEANLEVEAASISAPLGAGLKGDSPLGLVLASGLRRWTHADIGIVNAGQLLDGLSQGSVTQRRLLEICPSPINPCLMLIRGKDIAWAIEQSLQEEYQFMPIRGFGFRGKMLGGLCLSGVDVEYDPAGPPLQKVKRIFVRGELLDPDHAYHVGSIDMFSFGVGYPSLSKGKVLKFYLPEFIRDVLAAQLANVEIPANAYHPLQ